MKKNLGIIICVLSIQLNYGQILNYRQLNTITTAVPFLIINPNAQSMGIADIGVVASSEYYESGVTQNPALLSRNEKIIGGKFSYKPWLRHLVPDINMFDVNFYYAFNKKITLAYSFNYFSLGYITVTNANGTILSVIKPKEFYHNIKYAQSLTPNLSLGIGFKYIISDLTNQQPINGVETYKGKAFAGDIGIDYRKEIKKTETSFWRYDIGASILNIGNKVRYIDTVNADFIPTLLSVGTMWSYTKILNDHLKYSIDIAYQCEKLLVPTPPIYKHNFDSLGRDQGITFDSNGDPVIIAGHDPNRSVANAMYTSFYDAPNGTKEELKEIIHKVGIENRLVINDEYSMALRLGYFNENEEKGNRKFFTLGLGAKYKSIYLDYSTILFYATGRGYGYWREGISNIYACSITLGYKYTFK